MKNQNNKEVIDWLLEGDPSIRWQTLNNLTNTSKKMLKNERNKIETEGWGAKLLSYQDKTGTWAGKLYSPKWISTTYTMLLLRQLGLDPKNEQAKKACKILLDNGFYMDGGINYSKGFSRSETCITGMILSLLAYFKHEDTRIESLVEFLMNQQMIDGGWNCQLFKGATHGSFHTTILVLEGLREYEKFKPESAKEIVKSQKKGREFLLIHKLFRSHRTGEIIDKKMMRLSFPPQWHYDIMRSLDYFQECNAEQDTRIQEAIGIIKKKQTNEGFWNLQNRYPGRYYFEMERIGFPSRWNTLRALRILKWWEKGIKN